jgi:enoyl-[acyl-carrier protein] reductase I
MASPLRKNVTQEEVGDAALFLASDMSRSITGEVLYVDNGFNILGMTLSQEDMAALSGSSSE